MFLRHRFSPKLVSSAPLIDTESIYTTEWQSQYQKYQFGRLRRPALYWLGLRSNWRRRQPCLFLRLSAWRPMRECWGDEPQLVKKFKVHWRRPASSSSTRMAVVLECVFGSVH